MVATQEGSLMREDEGPRHVAIVLWKVVLHACQIAGQVVFAREHAHAREVVDLLVNLHAAEILHADCPVGPLEVPPPGISAVVGQVKA